MSDSPKRSSRLGGLFRLVRGDLGFSPHVALAGQIVLQALIVTSLFTALSTVGTVAAVIIVVASHICAAIFGLYIADLILLSRLMGLRGYSTGEATFNVFKSAAVVNVLFTAIVFAVLAGIGDAPASALRGLLLGGALSAVAGSVIDALTFYGIWKHNERAIEKKEREGQAKQGKSSS